MEQHNQERYLDGGRNARGKANNSSWHKDNFVYWFSSDQVSKACREDKGLKRGIILSIIWKIKFLLEL